MSTLHLAWDLDLERPTLGGALVLRQEAELLAVMRGCDEAWLHIGGGAIHPDAVATFAREIFSASALPFRLAFESPPLDSWPAADERRAGFSYFSFARLLRLYQQHQVPPRLRWSDDAAASAQAARARFSGRLICVHLRNVARYTLADSNADSAEWGPFLRKHARPGVLDFCLLGDDPVSAEISALPGVVRAAEQKLDLATQLALVGLSDGFLGMASGLCTAANLSAVPHVIFKHPAHHPAEMERELGAADRFPFAESRQHLWRRLATAAALDQALELILS